MKTVKSGFPLLEIIMLTAYGNLADDVQSIKNGAFDSITKGDDNDRIIPLLYQALESVILRKTSAVKVDDKTVRDFGFIIGDSAIVKHSIQLAQKSSRTDATVLLLGETGTGKEIFANTIHYNSKRRGHSMVAINCSAFTKELLKGELFGHKEGAYTGASKDKKGLIEVADGGTFYKGDRLGCLFHFPMRLYQGNHSS